MITEAFPVMALFVLLSVLVPSWPILFPEIIESGTIN